MAKRIQMRKNRFLAIQKMAEQKKNEALHASNANINNDSNNLDLGPKQTVSPILRRIKLLNNSSIFALGRCILDTFFDIYFLYVLTKNIVSTLYCWVKVSCFSFEICISILIQIYFCPNFKRTRAICDIWNKALFFFLQCSVNVIIKVTKKLTFWLPLTKSWNIHVMGTSEILIRFICLF